MQVTDDDMKKHQNTYNATRGTKVQKAAAFYTSRLTISTHNGRHQAFYNVGLPVRKMEEMLCM